MTGFGADLKHALRIYARTPVASGFAVFVLAIAMAFVGSFLSLYIDLAYKPNPAFNDSRQLVTIGQNDGTQIGSVSWTLIERINEEMPSIAAMSGFTSRSLEIGPNRETRNVEFVSAHFFSEIRPRLALGRGFEDFEHEAGAEPVAVISYDYWQQAYGGTPDVIGDTILITGQQQFNFPGPDGEPAVRPEEATTEFRIVGVVSDALPALAFGDSPIWLPFEAAAPLYLGPWANVQHFQLLRGLGRLAPGATQSGIATELTERYQQADDLNLNPDQPFDAYRGLVIDINAQRSAKRQLELFLAGSLLMALVAAANVSLFLLSRAPGRQRELGIRMSVGAPLKRLARQLATEAGFLVVLSAAAGLVVGYWLQTWLQGIAFLDGARWQSIGLFDWRVLVVLVVILSLLTLLVSLAPVAGLKKLGIASSTRRVAMRAGPTQRAACTLQISIAGVVAAAAIAFGWYLGLLVTGDHGYSTDDIHLVTFAQLGVGAPGFNTDFEGRLVDRERRRALLSGLTGIDAVAFGSSAPGISVGGLVARITRPDAGDETVQFQALSADREYFELLDIDVIGGRLYDGDEADVMVVNETAAIHIWGRPDVAGETLPISLSDAGSTSILGVVEDIPHGHPDSDVQPRVYLSIIPFGSEIAFVRSALPTSDIRALVQSLVDSGELDVELADVVRFDIEVGELIAADRARGVLTIIAAVVVLLLAGFGFYGTQRYLVAAGRREYAIRASIGAGPRALGRLVLGRALGLSLPGVLVAGLLAFIVAAWLRDDFVSRDVTPGVITLAVVAGLLGLLLAASLGPARQARRTQPAPLLREE